MVHFYTLPLYYYSFLLPGELLRISEPDLQGLGLYSINQHTTLQIPHVSPLHGSPFLQTHPRSARNLKIGIKLWHEIIHDAWNVNPLPALSVCWSSHYLHFSWTGSTKLTTGLPINCWVIIFPSMCMFLSASKINQFTVGSHSALPSVNQSFPKVTFSQSVNLIQVSKFQCQLLDSHQISEN